MGDIAVKKEPSEAASPETNGAVAKEAGSIAETIEAPLKAEAPVEPAPVVAKGGIASPADHSSERGGTPSGAPKKAPKKKAAIARPKNATAKTNKKASSRTDKASANGTKPPSGLREDDNADEDEDEDGGEGVFCICRGPDDHTWMIGCDGDCEDWFHGRCVNIAQSDADLIEQYICPNCAIKGKRQTTWKPMCRLEGCRRPARVNDSEPSKYCSDAHGEEYFRRRVMQKTRRNDGPPPAKKRQADSSDYESNQAHLHGGLLSRSEVKALSDSVSDGAEFNRLGDAMLSPDGMSGLQAEDKGPTVTETSDQTCTPEERDHLKQVLDAAARARHSLNVLADKEKFLKLARAEAALKNAGTGGSSSADLKKKETFREVCGYDSRLSWNEEEFDSWRRSDEGRSALESGSLPPPVAAGAGTDADGDSAMTDDPVDEPNGKQEAVCQKRRCDRHKTWWKIHYQSIMHERHECHQQLEKLGAEARGIQERAMVKGREQAVDSSLVGT